MPPPPSFFSSVCSFLCFHAVSPLFLFFLAGTRSCGNILSGVLSLFKHGIVDFARHPFHLRIVALVFQVPMTQALLHLLRCDASGLVLGSTGTSNVAKCSDPVPLALGALGVVLALILNAWLALVSLLSVLFPFFFLFLCLMSAHSPSAAFSPDAPVVSCSPSVMSACRGSPPSSPACG